jgi:four helix bundle protein
MTKRRFECYAVALEMVRGLAEVLVALEQVDRDLARQARRAATSVPLNLAEGNRRAGKDRLHLFRVAAGSADEVRAVLDVAEAWGYVPTSKLEQPREHLDRILAMAYRLTHRGRG